LGQDNPPPPAAVTADPKPTQQIEEQPVPNRADVFPAREPQPVPACPAAAPADETIIEQIEKLSAAIDAEDFEMLAQLTQQVGTTAERHGLQNIATPAAVLSRLVAERNVELILLVLKDLEAIASKLKTSQDDAPSMLSNPPRAKSLSHHHTPVFVDIGENDFGGGGGGAAAAADDDDDVVVDAQARSWSPESTSPATPCGCTKTTCPESEVRPIRSSLPIDDPEFREIAEEFVQRLDHQRVAMQAAWDGGNLHELERLAHWLKDASSTAGFDTFTGLGRDLEKLARGGIVNRITDKLNELTALTARIDLDAAASDEPSSCSKPAYANFASHDASSGDRLESTLPIDDPEFREIVEEFVERLREKIDAMRDAWQADEFQTLAELAHWLKGSGGTAGFVEFTTPARELERAAKAASRSDAQHALQQLQRLTARITVPAIGA
jgi:HPt (histidine-containing phosphotransfer) domain-containing protein